MCNQLRGPSYKAVVLPGDPFRRKTPHEGKFCPWRVDTEKADFLLRPLNAPQCALVGGIEPVLRDEPRRQREQREPRGALYRRLSLRLTTAGRSLQSGSVWSSNAFSLKGLPKGEFLFYFMLFYTYSLQYRLALSVSDAC